MWQKLVGLLFSLLHFDDIMHRKEAYLDKEQKNDKPYDFQKLLYCI